jgi:hypothetical protein
MSGLTVLAVALGTAVVVLARYALRQRRGRLRAELAARLLRQRYGATFVVRPGEESRTRTAS